MLNKKKNNKGFTLVELRVVIAIIGILAVVAVPALFKNIEKGKVADLESDISAIRSAVLSYYTNNSEYPIDPGENKTIGETSSNDDKPPILTQDKKTAISGGESLETEDNKPKYKASLALFDELEGLSFPYEGSYQLTDKDGTVTPRSAVKSPNTLYLKITTEDENTTISTDGLDKLAQDLGLTQSSHNSNSTASKTNIGVINGASNQIIIIPLVNK